MQLLKLVVTAWLPLASVFSSVVAANPRADQSASRFAAPLERAFAETLINTKRSAATPPTIESRQDLTSDLSQLLSLISELGEFLNADFLNATYNVVVNLNGLLSDPFVSDTRGIITEASGLLTSLAPLISQITSIDIGGIFTAISPLLTTSSINGISTLLTNAENLLTADFVSETVGLINDVAPVSFPLSLFCGSQPLPVVMRTQFTDSMN